MAVSMVVVHSQLIRCKSDNFLGALRGNSSEYLSAKIFHQILMSPSNFPTFNLTSSTKPFECLLQSHLVDCAHHNFVRDIELKHADNLFKPCSTTMQSSLLCLGPISITSSSTITLTTTIIFSPSREPKINVVRLLRWVRPDTCDAWSK
jgi:hypothetical protein